MPRPLPRMNLTVAERLDLERVVRSHSSEQRAVLRASIVLRADEGWSTRKIADALSVCLPVVVKWRRRFAVARTSGLSDEPRKGRPREYDAEVRLRIATEACRPPDGSTHWSTRDLADHLGLDHLLVHRVLKTEGIKPHLHEMWLNSQDPDFEPKKAEIVGLYLAPPENALVLCIDEKTGMQALGRKHPDKPVRAGSVQKREFEYVRHGTKSLLAALAVHEGSVTGKCYDRHTHVEFLDFLGEVERQYPDRELHFIVDNLSVHKHEKVAHWLIDHKNVTIHFTPTHASWLNQIELWFSILSRKILRRGIFNSKEELVAKILDFIERYNQDAKPFRWTYTGDPLAI